MEITESLQLTLSQYPEARPILDNLSRRYWRLNNLYSIKDKQGNKIPFRFNWAQEILYKALWYLSIVLKARQIGFTTFFCLLYLDDTLFSQNKTSAIIAHKVKDAQKIFRDKVKFAWDNLPDWLKDCYDVNTDNKDELVFSLKGSGGRNSSSISVSTSVRSGTVQNLHISEHGYICQKYPDKAEEIRTGALNAVEAGQMISIESTSKGSEGDFYNYCQRAMENEKLGRPLTKLDFKFFFFPWWKHPEYVLDTQVVISKELEKYFEELEVKIAHKLTSEQKWWYTKKKELVESGWADEEGSSDMFAEYPSTPEEAFAASIEGAYYSSQMQKVVSDGRITKIPWIPTIPVDTWWDLGIDDYTVILMMQQVGTELHFIDCIYGSGEGLEHYASQLKKLDYIWGRHIMPHDIEVRELGTGKSRLEIARRLGIRPITVAPKLSIDDGIQAARVILPRSYFDEVKCKRLIENLKNYRKKWDDKLGQFLSHPLHNEHSHGADAFRTGAVIVRDNIHHASVVDDDGKPVKQVVAPQAESYDEHDLFASLP